MSTSTFGKLNSWLQITRSLSSARLLVLYQLFKEIDTDDTGCISPDNLKELVAQTGADVTDEQIDELVGAIDQTDEGTINFKEFVVALIVVLKAAAGEEE